METRIALIGIILESRESVDELNHLLSKYGEYVIGRMGIPYREKGIHVCAETNGHIADAELIAACDAIICDVKNQESDDLSVCEPFLSECRRQGKEVQLTCVLVPEKNGTEQKIAALASLAKKYGIQKIKFLPFRKLCEEKYKDLSLPFPYAGFREGEPEDVGQAEAIFAAELAKNG